MKCFACNYEYIIGTNLDDVFEIVQGDDPFIRLAVDAVNYRGSFIVDDVKHSRVHLYACPKCGTVRMEK
jgi:hypothetical protein